VSPADEYILRGSLADAIRRIPADELVKILKDALTEHTESLPGVELGSTCVAAQARPVAEVERGLEHHLSPDVETALTNVVHSLRACWLRGMAFLWGQIHPIRKIAATHVDQRVALALIQGFSNFSEFLAAFEMLVLELEQGRPLTEQRILCVEQFVVQRGDFFGDEVPVTQSSQRHADVFGRFQGVGSGGE